MIVKSMSRKVPSFGQLVGYIDRESGHERYRIRHNLLARDPERIREEFETNASLLQKRKNGVYLYHEILSITRAQGLTPDEQKERLYQISQDYIAARCPDNLVYGGLHQDKEHSYHFHLMISSNRAGEEKRLRLSKAQFREVQVKLEEHVLLRYPELEQKLAIGKRSDRRISQAEAELERRTGSRPERQTVLDRVREALETSIDRETFLSALGRSDLELYVRGKNLGVVDLESGKKHRINTLDPDLMSSFEARLLRQIEDREKPALDGEKEKSAESEPLRHKTERDQERKAKTTQAEREPMVDEKEQPNFKSSGLEAPSPERKEKIERDEIEPDPLRDKMPLEDWAKRDTFSHKAVASIKRTGRELRDALEGKEPERKAQRENHAEREKKPDAERNKESSQQRAWRDEINRSRGQSRGDKDRGRE